MSCTTGTGVRGIRTRTSVRVAATSYPAVLTALFNLSSGDAWLEAGQATLKPAPAWWREPVLSGLVAGGKDALRR